MMVKTVQNSNVPEPASDEIKIGDVFCFVMNGRNPKDGNNLRVVHKIKKQHEREDQIWFHNGSWANRSQLLDPLIYIRHPSS